MTLGPFVLDEIYRGDCRELLKQLSDEWTRTKQN